MPVRTPQPCVGLREAACLLPFHIPFPLPRPPFPSPFFHFCYVLHGNLISVLFPGFLFFYIYLHHRHSPPVQLPHLQVFLRYCQNGLYSELRLRAPWRTVHAFMSPSTVTECEGYGALCQVTDSETQCEVA